VVNWWPLDKIFWTNDNNVHLLFSEKIAVRGNARLSIGDKATRTSAILQALMATTMVENVFPI